MMMNENELNVA